MSNFSLFRGENCYLKVVIFSIYTILAYAILSFSLGSMDDSSALLMRSFSWMVLIVGFILLFKPRFSHFTWFWFSMALTYGSWPIIAFTYTLVIPFHPATELIGHSMSDYSMFESSDLLFLFTGLVLSSGIASYSLLSKKAKFSRFFYPASDSQNSAKYDALLKPILLLAMVSVVAHYLASISPKVLQQLLLIIAGLREASFVILIGIANYKYKSGRSGFIELVFAVGVVLIAGTLGFFLAGGHKGAVLVQILCLMVFAFVEGVRKVKLYATILVASCFCLIPLLPKINAMKSLIHSSGGKISGAKTSLTVSESDTESMMFRGSNNSWDYFLIYTVIRVNLTPMTATYYDFYKNSPMGWSSLAPVVWAFIPRVFAPNKIDLALYYNEIARTSGVGNEDDVTTFRRPFLMEEAYFVAGLSGVVFFGVVFGLVLGIISFVSLRIINDEILYFGLVASSLVFAQGPVIGDLPAWILYKLPPMIFVMWILRIKFLSPRI
jgi:hypothetical protein